MLHEIFYWVLNMSILAALTGLPVLLLRCIRKIPRRISVLLWLAPFLRMSLPVGLSSRFSLMSLLSGMSKSIVVHESAHHTSWSVMNITQAAESYFPIAYKAAAMEKVFTWAGTVWLIVFLAILLTLGAVYAATLRELREAVERDGIFYSDRITAPAVYGILRPRILLPNPCEEGELPYVLLHERMHVRRRDNLWRLLAAALTAMHWFNPFAWVFLKKLLTDLELACDECVLSSPGVKAKTYARALLNYQSDTNAFVSAFGGATIRTRIENILFFRRMTWISAAGFMLLLCAILFVLLTNR